MRASALPCRHPGCGALVRDGSGYCAAHQHARQSELDRRRGSAHQRGYSRAWAKARAAYLAKHPLCVRCGNEDVLTAASVVDHIKPHRGDKDLFWDSSNWQSLCKRCHDIKTATEDGGWGNAPRSQPADDGQ